MRYFLEIAYKGTDFHGWQKQPNATSIQAEIQAALTTILKNNIEIVGAGRTDAGVHAKQLFAHFDTHQNIEKKDVAYSINSMLPHSIVIKRIYATADLAHARFDATSRSYEYHIHLKNNPFLLDTTWLIPHKTFDVQAMNKAANTLLKHTNFKAFSKSKTDVKTYDCVITKAEWIQTDDHLIFYITANRFLRNMVRAIVGTLLEVGEGKLTSIEFENIILSQNRSNAGVSVPARGLFLTEVNYPKETLKDQN